jgi:hypothetical protein
VSREPIRTGPCKVVNHRIEPCPVLSKALEPSNTHKGLSEVVVTNLETLEIAWTGMLLRSGDFCGGTNKGILINFRPFCGVNISEQIPRTSVKREAIEP